MGGGSGMLQRFPEGVKWRNDRGERLLRLSGALLSTTLWLTLGAMIGVATARGFTEFPQGVLPWLFAIMFSTILLWKVVAASFELWRTLLWLGRTVFRPRGTQAYQFVATSFATLIWMSAILVVAIRFAEPVLRFLKRTGISISF